VSAKNGGFAIPSGEDDGSIEKIHASSLQGVPKPTRAHSGSVHSSQGHRNLKDLPNFSRSKIPRPPTFLDMHTRSHFTLYLPPKTLSEAAHEKALISIAFKMSFGSGKAV
jgi:hypothetical protein